MRDDALDMYNKMSVIRRLETAAGNMYKEKLIRGFCHLYSGQVWLLLKKLIVGTIIVGYLHFHCVHQICSVSIYVY